VYDLIIIIIIIVNITYHSLFRQTSLYSHCVHRRYTPREYRYRCCDTWTGRKCMLHSHSENSIQ